MAPNYAPPAAPRHMSQEFTPVRATLGPGTWVALAALGLTAAGMTAGLMSFSFRTKADGAAADATMTAHIAAQKDTETRIEKHMAKIDEKLDTLLMRSNRK